MSTTVVNEIEAKLARDAAIRVQELTALQALQLNINSNRPVKTKNTWAGKQKEYYEWNTAKGYPDELLTADKFLLFLTEMKNRPVYRRGRKRRAPHDNDDNEEDGDDANVSSGTAEVLETRKIGWNTLDGYVTAVMDIWKKQHMLGKFPPNFPQPVRPPAVKEFLKNAKKEVMTESSANYEDRGIGTLSDEISAHDQGRLAHFYWTKDSEEGLKQRADFLLSFGLMSRGDNLRNLKLSEVGHRFYPEEGVAGSHLLRTVWRKLKKNQYGNIQQNALMRHKDVSKCPFGALGLYLFYRYHVREDPWPDFSKPDYWYDIYVFPNGTRCDKPMTYTKQYQGIKMAQEQLGISVTSKTQIGRKTGASYAENSGANEASIDKNGHWAVKSRNGAYTNNVVPWECVRVLAGFASSPNQYNLERAILEPPPALQKKIFNHVDNSLSKIENCLRDSDRKSEISGKSFLALMTHFRIVILQDAAILSETEDYKDHSIFQHPVFTCEEFKEYSDALKAKINATENPLSLRLAEVFPELSQQLVQINRSAHNHSSALQDQEKVLKEIGLQLEQHPRRCISLLSRALSNGVTTVLSEATLNTDVHTASRDNDFAASESNAQPVSRNYNNPTAFKMNRSISTVREAWTEFQYGGVSNNGVVIPPIEQLESRPGPKWRGSASSTEGKFYTRRKPLYDTVRTLMEEEEMQENDVLDHLQTLMAVKCKGSLRKLCDHLKCVLKNREEGRPLSVYIIQ
ncbi:hypothetical protein MP638_000537 [Amoeboaphelidium occidentale]|nr:hypothetical protein MP638_000537 [Amoeboaphelidium occidentale]